MGLTLTFEVTCDIVLGTKPDDTTCEGRRVGGEKLTGVAGRRRRNTVSTTEYTQSTEYSVTTGNRIAESHDGIVVAHSEKSNDESLDNGAVSAAVAVMAGTAVMLL